MCGAEAVPRQDLLRGARYWLAMAPLMPCCHCYCTAACHLKSRHSHVMATAPCTHTHARALLPPPRGRRPCFVIRRCLVGHALAAAHVWLELPAPQPVMQAPKSHGCPGRHCELGAVLQYCESARTHGRTHTHAARATFTGQANKQASSNAHVPLATHSRRAGHRLASCHSCSSRLPPCSSRHLQKRYQQ
jgi:hypothetical protein